MSGSVGGALAPLATTGLAAATASALGPGAVPLALAGVAGGVSGSSDGGDGDTSILSLINNMNTILGNAQTSAINSSTGYTNQAIQTQDTGLNSATSALNTGNTNANTALNNLSTTGAQSSNALTQPYSNAGYGALDMYEDSLGVARPAAGNAALANSLYNNAQASSTLNPLFSNLNSAASTYGVNPVSANSMFNIGGEAAAPVAKALNPTGGAATAQQVNILSQQMAGVPANQINPNVSLASTNPNIYAKAAQQLNQQMQNTLNGQAAQNAAITASNNTNQVNYTNYNNAYQAYNTALKNPNFTPQSLALGQAYNSGNVSAPQQVNVGQGGVVPGAR